MSEFLSLVDGTRFDLVRRLVCRPGSPITDVLFVSSRELLCQLAEVLTRSASGSGCQRLRQWFEQGRLSVGVASLKQAPAGVERIDLHSIDRQARCDVLYLPPYYLVHLTGGTESSRVEDSRHPDWD